MKIEKDTTYVLTLDYTDLHALYHMMLESARDAERNGCHLASTEEQFFQALKEHA